jgi:hypothetical protein
LLPVATFMPLDEILDGGGYLPVQRERGRGETIADDSAARDSTQIINSLGSEHPSDAANRVSGRGTTANFCHVQNPKHACEPMILAGRRLAQGDNPSNLTQHASWIANCQTIGWDISRYNATRANSAVASNADTGKNYGVRANPHVIVDHNWCGRRRHVPMFGAMLVPI